MRANLTSHGCSSDRKASNMRDSQIMKMVYHVTAVVVLMLVWPHSSNAADAGMTAVIASIHADSPIRDASSNRAGVRDGFFERHSGGPWFQTPVKWQSGVNIAGSRAWTKVIKFSSNGINIRLPLN